MRTLILVKHSLPEILPGVPAERWRLGEEGRRRCAPLTARLAPYEPTAIVASTEPKATETAVLVANELHRPVETVEGLREHDRGNVPFFATAEEWEAAVATFFARPEELVLGRETAVEARDRFVRSVEGVLAKYPGNVAVVAHGTVITLAVAHWTGLAPFPYWQRLGLPSFAVLSFPDRTLVTTLHTLTPG